MSLLRAAAILLLAPALVAPPATAREGSDEAPKQMRGLRFSTTTQPEDAPDAGAEAGDPKAGEGELPEGALKLGVVRGNSKLPPELADLAERGAVAVASQEWRKAREIYLEMIDRAPDNALAYANLGVAEHQLGNQLAAAGNLKKSLEINPSIARNWQTLGLIHYERGRLELAISSLTRAIHEAPDDARSRLYLAAVVRDYGWEEAAITELRRAIDTDPSLAEAHYNLAVTYLEARPPRLELARRHYYDAVDLGAEPAPKLEAAFESAAESDSGP